MPISLGQITFGIGPDTTRLRTSIQDITRFGTAVEAAARAAAGGATAGEAALRRQEAAAISALQRVQRFQDQVAKSAAPANLAQGFNTLSTRGLDQFVQRMTSGRLTAIQFQREMERFGVTMGNADRIFRNWNTQTRNFEQSKVIANMRQLASASALVTGPLGGVAARFQTVATLAENFNLRIAATVTGLAAGAYAFYKFSEAAIDTAKKLQTIEQTMTAVAGSAVNAQAQMKYLADFSDRAGVKVEDVAKSFGQMQAAAKGTYNEGERTNQIFEAIVLSGSKLGLSNAEVEASLRAVQQMMSKGVIQAEELKGQLGDRIPGAIQAMADALGVGTQQLFKLMEGGKVTTEVLVKFGEALKKRLGIDSTTKIDTIVAAENRLSNARLRAIDTLDRIIGVSSAYKNTLDLITSGLNYVEKNATKLIPIVAAVSAGLLAAFAAPAVVSGLAAITSGVVALATSIASLNAAAAAGGAASLLRLLATLGIAMAAGAAAYKLTSDALQNTTQSYLSALPPVDAYIQSQQKLTTMMRGTTREYLNQQETLKLGLTSQISKINSQILAALDSLDALEKSGVEGAGLKTAGESLRLPELQAEAARASQELQKTGERIRALRAILASQDKMENNPKKNDAEEMTKRQILATKNAIDTVRELDATYDAMFQSPAQKEWLLTQNDINRSIENFRDSLSRSELPASKVVELTDKYAAALRRVKEGELTLRRQVSAFQALGDIFSRGLDTGLDNWINKVMEGGNALESLKETAKAVAADIFKTFMTLAALNPIKNALFGLNTPTLGGNAGIGGLLGGLFGSSATAGASAASTSMSTLLGNTGGAFFGPGFANGGIMTPNGVVPLKTYAGGGIAHSPQMAMFGEGSGAEAFVPLPDGRRIPVQNLGGGSNVNIQVIEAPGTKAQVTTKKGSGGQVDIEVMIKNIAKGAIMEDLAAGGSISKGMEARYGLNRAKGMAS